MRRSGDGRVAWNHHVGPARRSGACTLLLRAGGERWCVVEFTKSCELVSQGGSDCLIVLFIMNTAQFVGVFLQVIQIPLVTFGKVDQLVVLGTDTEVLRHRMFTQFVVGVVERITPGLGLISKQRDQGCTLDFLRCFQPCDIKKRGCIVNVCLLYTSPSPRDS